MNTLTLIILAAGFSKRFGAEDKLLAQLSGSTVLEHSLKCFDGIEFAERILVVNSDGGKHAELGRRHGFELIINENAEVGMGTSIAASAQHAIGAGAMIALGDMPFIQRETIALLLQAFDASEGENIITPSYDGQRGHPVIFPDKFFPSLTQLKNDIGARSVMNMHADSLQTIPVEDSGVCKDIDSPEDYETAVNK